MRVVISQSMYFPWVGLLEQVRLADIFVHYDDVQFTRGFFNRVQIRTPQGTSWLTVPLKGHHRGQRIDEVLIDDRIDWRNQHRDTLHQHYQMAPFRDEMLTVVDKVFEQSFSSLADVSRASIIALIDYFNLASGRHFTSSKRLSVGCKSSLRLRDIVLALHGDIYITGHGARNYLNHALFEEAGIAVRYMQYRCIPYPQQFDGFTPYVTGLDLIANCGYEGIRVIQSDAIDWKEFLNEPN